MKRSAIKRRAPPAFVRPEREPRPNGVLYRPFNPARIAPTASPQPKQGVARSEDYRRLVAAMDCIHCGRAGPSQAAHADQGKGAHIKTDDRTCFPLCSTRPDGAGCHDIIGASGQYTREQRRELELVYGAQTRAAIKLSGQWPKNLEEL